MKKPYNFLRPILTHLLQTVNDFNFKTTYMKPLITLFLLSFFATNAFSQNSCAGANPVIAGTTYFVNAVDGTSPTFVCIGAPAAFAEWFIYVPTQDYSLTVTSSLPENVDTDTRLQIYSGTCDALVCVGSDDDSGTGFSSVATINVTAGTTYYIVFDSYWDTSGFPFKLIESDPIENLVTFTSVPIANGVLPDAAVDMNGDHFDDLVDVGTSVIIQHQQADGSFIQSDLPYDELQNSPSWSLAVGDLDNNGYNDILCGGGGGVSFLWANNEGTAFNETHDNNYVFCQRTNMIDINMDGKLDGFSCHDIAPNIYYINEGNGVLTFHQGGIGDTPDGGNYGSVWIDYDNDCDMDMFIAKCRGGNSAANINQMHRNNGDGTFTEVGAEIGLADNVQTWSSAWADYDNDGDMDVFVGASSDEHGTHKLMRNNGDGTFTDITAGSGCDLMAMMGIENAPGDFNNDGYVDVFASGGRFLINNGDMTFTESGAGFYSGPIADLNNDGFLDIVSGSTIQMNDGNNNNYLKINTVGVVSNKNGIGARVSVFTPTMNQIRDVRSGEGFRYMSSLNTHFGLGTETNVTMVRVCWPSGIIDEVLNPPINGLLTIQEGSSPSLINEEDQVTLRVYPNPAEDILNISYNGSNATMKIIITDMSGKTVLNTITRNKQVDVTNLATGIYSMQAVANDIMYQTTFTKK
jgi:hypothetical protein